jgi:threonine dehydratase
VLQVPPEELRNGVVTATAGNMGQGVAWIARELGVPSTVVVPEHAPETKLAAMKRLGARIEKVPYDRWWEAIETSSYPEAEGVFIHPVQDERVMAGNGTIGLELLDDLPEPDVVLVPFGGGGLSVGIASAVKALRPDTRVYAVEPEPGAPLTAAFATGEPHPIE